MSEPDEPEDSPMRVPVFKASTEESEDEAGGWTAAAIFDQFVTLAIAIGIALAIRGVLVEPFRIPSGSMLPTLLVGDHLFVNKFVYGPRLPFTDARMPGVRDPERGDVVVFEVARPMNRRGQRDIVPVDRAPEGSPREDFVKRLVGLPGDRITIKGRQVFVNDELLPLVMTGEVFDDSEAGMALSVGVEDLGACRHSILDDPRTNRYPRDSWVVEPGRYFMMGDNRDNSNDSRAWGTVRHEELKGPAFILYWSWDVNGNMLSFFNPMNWVSAEKRWDRVFQRVRCSDAEGPVETSLSGLESPARVPDPMAAQAAPRAVTRTVPPTATRTVPRTATRTVTRTAPAEQVQHPVSASEIGGFGGIPAG